MTLDLLDHADDHVDAMRAIPEELAAAVASGSGTRSTPATASTSRSSWPPPPRRRADVSGDP